MRFLVTGGTGFIGSHLVRALVAAGHHVTALVRDPRKAAAAFPPGVELLAGDLSLFERPDLTLAPADVVVHLAGVVAAASPDEYDAVNFVAVKHLVAALARQAWKPRRFLFASSLAAAGPSATRTPLRESDPAQPVEPYGRGKLAAEQFLAAEAPFPTTSFRPSLVFGPRDPATLQFFKMATRGVGFRIAGPAQALSVIDVDDAVAGILAMADDAGPAHHVYFLTGRELTDTESMWATMAAAIDRRVRVIRVPRALLRVAQVASTAAARVFRFTNRLDAKQYEQMVAPAFLCSSAALESAHAWRPRVSFQASLAKAYAAYRADGWL
jgi:nucleoside-diphosphate-sugar epimerase